MRIKPNLYDDRWHELRHYRLRDRRTKRNFERDLRRVMA